jgi:asparagine synthase (glutamine-hydrolysing)
MCGIVGFLKKSKFKDSYPRSVIINRMLSAISTRGPDYTDQWEDSTNTLNIGHARLSIVDLTSLGNQPMHSESGRYVISFNGEIYNHQLLRKELDSSISNPLSNYVDNDFDESSIDEKSNLKSLDNLDFLKRDKTVTNWRGNSDTETLLACFDAWGIQASIERAVGMFAIAVWDKKLKILTLIRDRLGEKPLYYGWHGSGDKAVFLFGSELKALKQHPDFDASIDRNALCLFMRHGYVPAPYSIYQGIEKLEPGCLVIISVNQQKPIVTRYWSATQIAIAGVAAPFAGTPSNAVDTLEGLLKSSIQQQMVADVPLGAFLSGGIDSSTVVALMQTLSSQPVKTFTIGINHDSYNEAVQAKAVAKHLGTDHSEVYVSHNQARDVIPLLPSLYCEPFADSSQIPTFLVSKLARQQVTVSLSGDAGDELFGGYNRYVLVDRLWRNLSALPMVFRQIAAHCIQVVPPGAWDRVAKPLQSVLPKTLHQANLGDKLHKAATVLCESKVNLIYLRLVSQWNNPASVVIGGNEPITHLIGEAPELQGLDEIQRMMLLDTISYLPDDILVKLDRATMGVSLEGRVPFLDHRIVEFAWQLPQNLKIRNGVSKWVLREVLYRHVPKEIMDRPKMGFGVPIGDWLRGPLRDWAEALLDKERLEREGFFHSAPIREKWQAHLSGSRNWQHHLWTVLMFQAWLENSKSN